MKYIVFVVIVLLVSVTSVYGEGFITPTGPKKLNSKPAQPSIPDQKEFRQSTSTSDPDPPPPSSPSVLASTSDPNLCSKPPSDSNVHPQTNSTPNSSIKLHFTKLPSWKNRIQTPLNLMATDPTQLAPIPQAPTLKDPEQEAIVPSCKNRIRKSQNSMETTQLGPIQQAPTQRKDLEPEAIIPENRKTDWMDQLDEILSGLQTDPPSTNAENLPVEQNSSS